MLKSFTPLINISTGDDHTLGLKGDKTLWSWGGNRLGQLGDNTRSEKHEPKLVGENFAKLSTGQEFSIGLKTDGLYGLAVTIPMVN